MHPDLALYDSDIHTHGAPEDPSKFTDRGEVSKEGQILLANPDADELWVHFPPQFLLWVLVMAGIASARRTDRMWLLQTLKWLRHKLALDSWEAAKAFWFNSLGLTIFVQDQLVSLGKNWIPLSCRLGAQVALHPFSRSRAT